MRSLLVIVLVFVASAPRPSEACVQLQEANHLVGWTADGTLALHVRTGTNGVLDHAEIHPTRYEGWRYVINEVEGKILVVRAAVGECAHYVSDAAGPRVIETAPGPLTEDALMKLATVKSLQLVPVPTDDGGAGKLRARFTPKKRYGEKQVELYEGAAKIATLTVPIWCVGSCYRDEDWKRFGASVLMTARAGDRTLYVLRMKRVCNGGNGKDMWIDRVIAVPGTEPKPKFSRCRGSGE